MHVGPLLDLNEVMSRTEGNQRPQCFNSKCPHGCLTIVALMWHHICVLHAQSFVSINEQDTACEESSGRNLFAHMMGNVSQDQRTGNTGLFRAVSSSPVAGNWFTYVPQYLALGGQGTRCSCLFLRNFYNHRQHLAAITPMKLYCWDIHIVCHIGTMKFPWSNKIREHLFSPLICYPFARALWPLSSVRNGWKSFFPFSSTLIATHGHWWKQ